MCFARFVRFATVFFSLSLYAIAYGLDRSSASIPSSFPGKESLSGALVYAIDFEDGELPTGVSGSASLGPGYDGRGLHLEMPDGRFDVDVSEASLGATGTISWWVRPRPAVRAWRDAGWRYFMHLRSERDGDFQLDLWRHPRTNFRISASMGMRPFQPVDYPPERLELETEGLDAEAWQHLVVSWDLRGDPQRLWLLLNGEGEVLRVPAGTFSTDGIRSVEFGNRPSSWDVPYLPMDGAVDRVKVFNHSVEDLLE